MATTKRTDDQKMKDLAATTDGQEGLRQGREDLKKGRVRLAREFFREFEVKRGTIANSLRSLPNNSLRNYSQILKARIRKWMYNPPYMDSSAMAER